MDRDPYEGFPPVDFLNKLTPFSAPQTIPGSPHNLPSDRPVFRPFVGVSGPAPSTGPLSGGGFEIVDLHHYASLITGLVAVGIVSAVSPFLTESGNRRNFLGFRNNSATANVFLDFGVNATAGSWLRLTPNQIVLFDAVVPQNDVYAFADAVGGSLAYAYSTIALP